MNCIYQRLLTLAQSRYFEFDSINDILLLCSELSSGDHLIHLLDERILKISDRLSLNNQLNILNNETYLKRRDRTVIGTACHPLLKRFDSLFTFPRENPRLSISMLEMKY